MAEQVQVVVSYVGKADFTDEVPVSADIQSIKVRAMRHFDLDPGSAGQYVLQLNGGDVADHGKIGSLGAGPIRLELTLKQDVPKG
jgi:hypothetical protein